MPLTTPSAVAVVLLSMRTGKPGVYALHPVDSGGKSGGHHNQLRTLIITHHNNTSDQNTITSGSYLQLCLTGTMGKLRYHPQEPQWVLRASPATLWH